MPEPDFYQFDKFEIDTRRRLLTLSGKPVPLKPRVFDTLLYLASNQGRVLEKDELMRAIWPDTSVEENNLNQHISALRRVFGEQRGENRYIVTVPGRGYKFVVAKPRFTEQTAEPEPGHNGSLVLQAFKAEITAPPSETSPGDSSGQRPPENLAIRTHDSCRVAGRSGSGWNRQLSSFASAEPGCPQSRFKRASIAVLVWVGAHNLSPRTELTARRLTGNSSGNRIRNHGDRPGRQASCLYGPDGYLPEADSGPARPIPCLLPPGFLAEVDDWFRMELT